MSQDLPLARAATQERRRGGDSFKEDNASHPGILRARCLIKATPHGIPAHERLMARTPCLCPMSRVTIRNVDMNGISGKEATDQQQHAVTSYPPQVCRFQDMHRGVLGKISRTERHQPRVTKPPKPSAEPKFLDTHILSQSPTDFPVLNSDSACSSSARCRVLPTMGAIIGRHLTFAPFSRDSHRDIELADRGLGGGMPT